MVALGNNRNNGSGRTRMICDRIKKEKMKCAFTLIRKLALTN